MVLYGLILGICLTASLAVNIDLVVQAKKNYNQRMK